MKRWNEEPLLRGNDSKAGNERDQVRVATRTKDHGSRTKINITTARPMDRASIRENRPHQFDGDEEGCLDETHACTVAQEHAKHCTTPGIIGSPPIIPGSDWVPHHRIFKILEVGNK